LATLSPFLALYYQILGLSGGEMGLLLGLLPLVATFAAPFWTGLADVRHWHKAILMVTLVVVVVIMAVFPDIGATPLLFPAVVIYAFFSAPIISLIDSATVAALGENKDKYGRIRLWGTIGWGIAAPIAGGLLQRFGLQWAFWIYATVLFIAILPASQMVFTCAQPRTPFRKGLRKLLTDRSWIFFLAMVFVTGIGLSVSSTYLSVLMNSLGGTKTMTGWALTVSTLSELPVMFFSYLLLRRLKVRGMFLLAITMTGIRSLLYAFIWTPGGIIAVQLLHGLTYSAMWVAGVTYASENAPAGLTALALGIFGSTQTGFGAAAGSLLGGLLIGRFGPEGMYGLIGAGELIGLVLFLLLERIFLHGHLGEPSS
jgi:PPP family 3-phenylpropionic acid transporter